MDMLKYQAIICVNNIGLILTTFLHFTCLRPHITTNQLNIPLFINTIHLNVKAIIDQDSIQLFAWTIFSPSGLFSLHSVEFRSTEFTRWQWCLRRLTILYWFGVQYSCTLAPWLSKSEAESACVLGAFILQPSWPSVHLYHWSLTTTLVTWPRNTPYEY